MRCRKLKSEPGAGKDIVSSFEFRVSSCLFGEVDAARSLNSELETSPTVSLPSLPSLPSYPSAP